MSHFAPRHLIGVAVFVGAMAMLVTLVVASRGGGLPTTGASPTVSGQATTSSGPASADGTFQGWKLTLALPTNHFQPGAHTTATLTVTWTGAQKTTLSLIPGVCGDVEAELWSSSGKLLWPTRRPDVMCPMYLVLEPWTPGQTRTLALNVAIPSNYSGGAYVELASAELRVGPSPCKCWPILRAAVEIGA